MNQGGGTAPTGVVIDRDKTTPLLLRVFWNMDSHNTENAYRDGLPKNELHFYTWKDATLKELSDLLKDVVAEARRKTCRLDFSLVYPDREGRLKLRHVGVVRNARGGDDGAKALRDISFETGDYLDIAVIENNERENRDFGNRNFGGNRGGGGMGNRMNDRMGGGQYDRGNMGGGRGGMNGDYGRGGQDGGFNRRRNDFNR